MSLQLKIDVKNNASKELIRLQKDLQHLNITIPKTSSNFSLLSKSMMGMMASTYALSKAYDMTIKRGLEYNNLIENQRNSIATLINVTSKNIDSQGKSLTFQEKMNLSLANSNKLMAELTRINANTPQTLGQTAQIFKTMYAPMKKVGATQEDLIYLTEKLAIASKVGGVEFNSLLAGVDGLASGTVLANSDLGRFLSSLGLTNKALKNSSDVVGLLKEKLKDFKAFDDLDTAISNLNVQWDTLTGNMTKDIFASQKTSIKEITKLLEEITNSNKDMDTLKKTMNSMTIGTVKFAKGIADTIIGITAVFDTISLGINGSIDFAVLGFKKLQLEYKEFMRNMRVEAVDVLGFDKAKTLGIDVDFNKQTKEIEHIKKDITDIENSLTNSGKSYITDMKGLSTTLNTFEDIKDVIVTNLENTKETTKELEKQSKISLVPKDNKTENNNRYFSMTNEEISLTNRWAKALEDYPKDVEKVNEDYLKEWEKIGKKNADELAKVDIGGAISTSIIDGINGSGLEDMLKNLSTSIGSSMINAGVGGIATAMGPTGVLAGGIALTAFGGLFGKHATLSDEQKHENLINKLNDEFKTFTDELKVATDRLENFGNSGSSIDTTLNTLLSTMEKSKKKQALEYARYGDDTWITGETFYEQATKTKGEEQLSLSEEELKKLVKDYGLTNSGSWNDFHNGNKQFAEDAGIDINRTGYVLDDISNASLYTKSKDELNKVVSEELPNYLDFSDMNMDSVKDLVKDFDQDAFNDTSDALNELSLKVKQNGGEVTQDDVDKFIELYDTNFILGQDYQDAIEIVNDYNEAIAETSKEMLKSSNDYELSFKSIGATSEQINDLKKAQIQEEMDYLSKELPELTDLTKDNFVSMYEAIDPANTDLIDSYEEYGDLLVDLAELNYEASDSLDSFATSIDNTIRTLKGNYFEDNTTASTNELIKDYNKAIRNNDLDTAMNLATEISNGAFGNTDNLNLSLIDSLEKAKLDIGITDEVMNVNIVSSEITDTNMVDYTPSVYVANSTDNTSTDQKLANIEALLTQLLVRNTSMDNTLDGFELNGLKIKED